ncbi:MAG: DUF1028 domain-containing protein [Acetobacteraceae bacterium]
MTWSILARDPETGALGAAVASRFFATGSICLCVEGGVAALSTQALVNPMYGVQAMPRLRAGEDLHAVLRSLVAPDPGADQRQFHVIGASGSIAQHTGSDCVSWAGHVSGTDVSVAGNMLAGPAVVQRTLAAFIAASGSLAERLMTAMEAGEVAGGDKRGKQSAALKICPRYPYPDRDIRADDHPDPLAELRRLYRVSRERFAVFRRLIPSADSPSGVLDRAVINDIIMRERCPP